MLNKTTRDHDLASRITSGIANPTPAPVDDARVIAAAAEALMVRGQLRDAGYIPLPLYGKAPPNSRNNDRGWLSGWQDIRTVSDDLLVRWGVNWPDATNTGVLTREMPTLDADIHNEAAACAVEALVRERYEKRGRLLMRIGQPPKRAFPFRTDQPFDKITIFFESGGKLEFLGRGQQVVVKGIHPDTLKPYEWFGGTLSEVARAELPDITAAEAAELMEEAAELLVREFGYVRSSGSRIGSGGGTLPDLDTLVANIHAGADLHDSTRDLAVKLAMSGTQTEVAIEFLQELMHKSKAPNDRRWQERYDDIERLVVSAEDKYGGLALVEDWSAKPLGESLRKLAANDNGETMFAAALPAKLMQTSAEFVANFRPPDYLIDQLLQRRYVYSFTSPTGGGKTSIALLIAVHVAHGKSLAGREVEKGRVLFFAGENPDDVRTRWIKLCEEQGLAPDTVDVVFMPFTLDLSGEKVRKQIDAEAAEHGPFSLLIVDTSAAYYSGDDENDNVKLGAHARMLRTFVDLPGGPTVLVTCHPVKTPNMDNLLPRGGGAFLAEVDGNLVCIKDAATMTVEVTTHGKFRGPDFEPFSFRLVAGQSPKLVDSKGRMIWTIVAREVTNEEQEQIEKAGHGEQDQMLHAMLERPGRSLAELAEHLSWLTVDKRPNKQRVGRVMKGLQTNKLVEKRRDGHYTLTKKGMAEAETTPQSKLKTGLRELQNRESGGH